MKTLLTYILFILMIAVPVKAADEFCGCLMVTPVNEPVTVGWTHAGADGYEVKIVHFFYGGLETEIVETTDLFYIITEFPKSSRHFEVQVRAFNEKEGDDREYSIWALSTDKEQSSFNGEACGWLIYTTPGAPSW